MLIYKLRCPPPTSAATPRSVAALLESKAVIAFFIKEFRSNNIFCPFIVINLEISEN